jgi:hypothetical protein
MAEIRITSTYYYLDLNKHVEVIDLKNVLSNYFKNYKFNIADEKIVIDINKSFKLWLFLSGKEIKMARTPDLLDIILLLIPVIGWIILFSDKKKGDAEMREILEFINIEFDEVKVMAPSLCPNCKNPNEKKVVICEWCGGNTI